MRDAFKPSVLVRYNIPDGGLVRIVSYLGEGWYSVITIPENRLQIASEDDLLLESEWKERYA